MPASHRIAALLATAAVAVASAPALAQSGGAGDQQYVDPFSGQSQQPSKPKTSKRSTTTTPAPAPAPAVSGSSTSGTGTSSTTADPTSSSAQTLPRTGMDAGFVAAIGLALLLTGVALRVRLRDERL